MEHRTGQPLAEQYRGVINEILRVEGWPRFTDDPHDRGGPTKGGITMATLAAWRRRPVTAAEVEALEEKEAREIYLDRYVTGPRFSEVPDDLLRRQVVDAGVLHGTERASRWLQEACGARADGRVGTLTLGALALRDPHAVAILFCRLRVRFIGALIAANYRARRDGRATQDQARFAGGWTARATEFLALEAAAGPRRG